MPSKNDSFFEDLDGEISSMKPSNPPRHKKTSHPPRPALHRNTYVTDARRQMHESWVAVIVFTSDTASRSLLGPIRLETRGLADVHEARNIHRLLINAARESYEETLRDVPDIEEKDLVKIIKADVLQEISERFDREPMIIPIIVGL